MIPAALRIPRLALWLVLAAYVVPLVFAVPLMEDDEGLHAAIAQEMVERGDWTVPRLFGEPFLDKPILYFWMQALSITVLGQSEFSIRLPGTLVALAGVWAIGWLAGRMFGAHVSRWAALCYATMLLPFGVSLAPLHDLVMVPLVVLAIGAFWHMRHAASAAALMRWTLLAGAALGVSLLGKGLTGLGLVGVGVVAWLLWTRALSWRLVIAGSAAIVLASIVAWPWYAAMERAAPGYLDYFFLERHVGGLTDNTQPHAGRPFWYYLPVVLAGAWPWLTVAFRRVRRPLTDGERLLWCWFLADIVVVSLAGSKLTTYILPAIPAVAALAAIGLGGSADSERSPRPPSWVSVITAALPIIAVVFLMQRQEAAGLRVTELVLASIPLLVLVWARTPSRRVSWRGAPELLLVTATTMVVATVAVRPLAAAELTARDLANQVNAVGELPPTILVVDEGIGSFVFYLRPDLRRDLMPGHIRRVSRGGLLTAAHPDGVVVAVAADRAPGLAELYDFPTPAGPVALGTYFIVPLADFRAKPPATGK